MRVAICDDEKTIADILEDKLEDYFFSKKEECEIRKFNSGNDLLQTDLSWIELLFLDVDMPGLSGLETATEIRKINKSMKIVFLTAYSEFVFESFKVDAFRYLLKPLKEKELEETLDTLTQESNDSQNYLCFQFNSENFNINIKDIIYIEGIRDKIWIFCEGGNYRWKGTLKDMMGMLEGKGIFQVHRSYLVNMDKIKSYSSKSVLLENDYEVPISKYRLDAFKEEYIRHWSKIL